MSTSTQDVVQVCEAGDLESLIRILAEKSEGLNSYVDLNELKLTDKRCTLLHIASRHNHVHIMDFLCSKGANVEALDKSEATPLHYAARNECCDAITFLARKGAQMNPKDCYEFTPLAMCLLNKQITAADILLLFKADLHVKVSAKNAPVLHILCKQDILESVRFVLDRGASLLRKDRNAESILCSSVLYPEIVELICKHADEQKILSKLVRMVSTAGENVFHFFAITPNASMKALEYILNELKRTSYTTIVDVLNERDTREMNTALHLAIEKQNFEMVELLCKYSEFLHFDVKNGHGDTVLHMAIKQENFAIFDQLLTADQGNG
jgi:ankyrin repeat protein